MIPGVRARGWEHVKSDSTSRTLVPRSCRCVRSGDDTGRVGAGAEHVKSDSTCRGPRLSCVGRARRQRAEYRRAAGFAENLPRAYGKYMRLDQSIHTSSGCRAGAPLTGIQARSGICRESSRRVHERNTARTVLSSPAARRRAEYRRAAGFAESSRRVYGRIYALRPEYSHSPQVGVPGGRVASEQNTGAAGFAENPARASTSRVQARCGLSSPASRPRAEYRRAAVAENPAGAPTSGL